MDSFILQYYKGIEDGSILVGKWIKLLYEYVLEGLRSKAWYYDHKKAMKAVCFIERFCRHHEGELGGQLIKLELWQKSFISVLFGIVDSQGNRQFNEILLVMARKQGKTLLASAIATYCAYADGEYGARVYMAAPKLQQANICYDQCYQTIKKEPELEKFAKKRRTDIYIEYSNSSIAPLAFSEKKSDGLNVSCAILDEIASWRGEAGLRFYEVLKSSVGARKQPILLGITTSGYENDGIYDQLIARATRLLTGGSKETHFLPLLYMIDDIDRWQDIEELKKANPNLGISVSPKYLLDELAITENSLSKKSEFLTKYACVKQNSSLAWLDIQTIKAMCGDPLKMEDFAHSYAVAGIDLSMSTDLTAAGIIVEKNGELYIFVHFWLPSERLEEAISRDGLPYEQYIARGFLSLSGENYIDYNDCYRWIVDVVERYEILPLMVGYDRYSANYLINDLKVYGFQVDDVYQGDNLYGVLQEMEGLFKDHKVHIGDNDLLKIHLLNSAIKMSTERGRGRLVKLKANDHIDGVAALADAFCVRQKWYEQIGERLKNER
ncbi:MAG: terminase large subunit [Clostridiales bacterium]|nr:terminase large subunit [Clostridiales bacterium]